MRKLFLLLALSAYAAACSDTSPTQVATSQLTFIRAAPTAPPIANAVDSFWAKKGENRQIQIWFRPAVGRNDSTMFLQFRVDADALYRRPDGSLIATGDSVLIHVTVADPVHLIVAFEPSGLQFAPTRPARMNFQFVEADDDLNGDGVVDATDATLKTQLRLYRQEVAQGPWTLATAAIDTSVEECDSDIFGFTNYALAY